MNRVLLENLIVTHLVKKLPAFVVPEGPLPCSQEPTTRPYPELDTLSPNFQPHFLKVESDIVPIYA